MNGDDDPDPVEPDLRPLLHTAKATARILGGVVTDRWLTDKAAAGEIPCTRLGRSVGWSDANIAEMIAENSSDSSGRKQKPRSR